MNSKSYNIEIVINDKSEEGNEEFFQSFFSRYQTGLETSMRANDFIFDCVYLLHYKCYEKKIKRGILCDCNGIRTQFG